MEWWRLLKIFHYEHLPIEFGIWYDYLDTFFLKKSSSKSSLKAMSETNASFLNNRLIPVLMKRFHKNIITDLKPIRDCHIAEQDSDIKISNVLRKENEYEEGHKLDLQK